MTYPKPDRSLLPIRVLAGSPGFEGCPDEEGQLSFATNAARKPVRRPTPASCDLQAIPPAPFKLLHSRLSKGWRILLGQDRQ